MCEGGQGREEGSPRAHSVRGLDHFSVGLNILKDLLCISSQYTYMSSVLPGDLEGVGGGMESRVITNTCNKWISCCIPCRHVLAAVCSTYSSTLAV